MTVGATRSDDRIALAESDAERLHERVGAAAARARRSCASRCSPSITVPIPAELDLSAAVLGARRPDDRFACLEQPDRDGFALAGLGEATTIEARGPGRFAEVATRARELGREAITDDPAQDPERPPAAGPVFIGGFAFAHDGGSSPEWSSLPPASLVLPEVVLSRQGEQARLTLNAVVQPDDDADAVVERLRRR